MRYGLVADNPIEEKVLKSHAAMRPLFEPFMPVLQARSIMAGVRLGIFEAIGNEAHTADQLAQMLSLDTECLDLLLRMLDCAGYVTRKGDQYSLTELTRSTLLPGSPMQLSGWMEHNYFHWNSICRLEEAVKTGKGVGLHEDMRDPAEWATYQLAMLETARLAAPGIASLVPIREGAWKMLDIGGSHGLYGAMMCRMHPPMRSEVLELPEAVEHARKLAHAEGIDDVVTHRSGDALKDDLGSDLDAVFLSNIMHHFTPDQNQQLFRRIKAALITGGTIAIWEFKRPEPDAEPDLIGDGMALLFRISSATPCYTPADYTGWIESAGFANVTIHPIPAPGQILVTGRVRD
jgi:SAM-dependent methyltransferase